jgi:hypothetical protein
MWRYRPLIAAAFRLPVVGAAHFCFKAETRPSDRCQDSMFATGSMVLMASGLKNDAGDADVTTRRLLINQGCDAPCAG